MTHFDYETTSACPIKLGAYRYASDPTTRILMFAAAVGEKEPLLWDFTDPYGDESLGAMERLKNAIESGELLYAHNALFEVAVSHYRMQPDLGLTPPPLEVYRCTQAMCKRAAAPESLAQASKFFDLEDKKDAAGKALIGIFSDQEKSVVLEPPPGMKDPTTRKPLKKGGFSPGQKPKNRRSASPVLDEEILWDWRVKVSGELMTVRDAWELFKEYCRQDVRAERELHKKLERFELKGFELASFQFDLKMNHRGVPVNAEALRHASKISEELKGKLSQRFEQITDLKPTQRGKTLEWLRERGYPEENLQAGTVQMVLENPSEEMTGEAVVVLKDYSLIQFAALAKIPAMLKCVCPDGTVKGTTQWHGARTGRASGRHIQVQNFRRPTIPDTDVCYKMVCDKWDASWFEDFWQSPLEALASSIRHFIQPPKGEKFYSSDFTGIEARLAPYIVGDERKLQMILDGIDLYKDLASRIFEVPYDKVTKLQRQISKICELACIYGAGGRTLRKAFAAPPFNIERSLEECKGYAKVYRDTHPETVQAWEELDSAAKDSIRNPGKKFFACKGRVVFLSGRVAGTNYLTMQSPSGRKMYYPRPTVEWNFTKYTEEEMEEEPWKREKGGFSSEQVCYFGKQTMSVHWGKIRVFPAKWLENLVQMMGAEFLNTGCMAAEAAGFDIRMIIHDEILAMFNGRPVEDLTKAFCTKPSWAHDFILEAEGSLVQYYTK